jgi:hypothetical protein
MILARGGKEDAAFEAFNTAAEDPAIDFGTLAGFWDLPRPSMMCAVRAYERVGRVRDAAALEARVRHTFRPRSIRTAQQRPTVSDRATASGD